MSSTSPAPLHQPERALATLIDSLTSRFPHADPTVVAALVREVHAELTATARVEAHLIALTQRHALDQLRIRYRDRPT